jgi:hypothetical protein
MSNREKYLKKHFACGVINVLINGQQETVQLALRKTTKAPIMGDMIHIRSLTGTNSPWLPCRVTTVEGDTLPIYHLKLEPIKLAPVRPVSTPKRDKVVKAVIEGQEVTMNVRGARLKVGKEITGYPRFKRIIPEAWATYRVVDIDHQGCTRYHLQPV